MTKKIPSSKIERMVRYFIKKYKCGELIHDGTKNVGQYAVPAEDLGFFTMKYRVNLGILGKEEWTFTYDKRNMMVDLQIKELKAGSGSREKILSKMTNDMMVEGDNEIL